MAITTSQPAVLPPTPQVTCDKIWVEQQIITAPIDGGPVTAYLVCRPYYQDEQGNKVFAPENQRRTYTVADLYALAATNTAVATALAANLDGAQSIITAAEQPQGN